MIYEQYQAVKQAQPNHVLLMEVGDFYHAFDNDAQTLAAVTESNVRTMTTGEKRVSTCCVPTALVDSAIEALLLQGYTVAVAQPVKEPEPGHTVQRVVSDARLTREVNP
jgi:DNA mismatch repair protein MutS